MNDTDFVGSISGFTQLDPRIQVDYLAFYLLGIGKKQTVTAADIKGLFRQVDVMPYSRIGPYLSEQASKRNGKYVKVKTGYRLSLQRMEQVRADIGEEPKRVQVATILKERLTHITDPREHAFLKEATDCFRVEAFRATIILVWILTVDHMARYVFSRRLAEFNSVLAKNPDRRIKQICKIEDFSELPEVKFIELLRAADVISNDVRKILDEKLGIRNSAAHPSDVQFEGHKATEFASDLLTNVILRFPIS